MVRDGDAGERRPDVNHAGLQVPARCPEYGCPGRRYGRNPCQIPGAGSDRAKERPVASPAEVVALVEAITPRYRAAVLLAAWCGLRRGEVLGLRRDDVDLRAGTVTVRRNRVELLESPVAFDADLRLTRASAR